jgi:hypothetical protein
VSRFEDQSRIYAEYPAGIIMNEDYFALTSVTFIRNLQVYEQNLNDFEINLTPKSYIFQTTPILQDCPSHCHPSLQWAASI